MTASAGIRESRGSWTHEYWFAHCEGYRVDAPDGHLGFVEEVVRTVGGEPRSLAIRTGCERGGLLTVPIHDVREIDPDAEYILVATVCGTTDRRSGSAPMSRGAHPRKLGS